MSTDRETNKPLKNNTMPICIAKFGHPNKHNNCKTCPADNKIPCTNAFLRRILKTETHKTGYSEISFDLWEENLLLKRPAKEKIRELFAKHADFKSTVNYITSSPNVDLTITETYTLPTKETKRFVTGLKGVLTNINNFEILIPLRKLYSKQQRACKQ